MQISLKSVAAAVALALASASALAAPGPVPNAQTGDGGLILAAWDPVRGIGATTYLGLTISQFQEAPRTPDTGLTLDFNVNLSVFGGDYSGVIYNIVAADNFGTTFSPADWQMLISGASVDPPNSIMAGWDGNTLGNATSSIDFFVQDVNIYCPTSDGCIAPNSSAQQYPGRASFGSTLNGGLSGNFETAGAIGTSLAFYILTGQSDILPDLVDIKKFANSGGEATWTLGTDGVLTYEVAPVPLPAAAWLLLSGLAGLGTISRRRSAARV